MPWVPAAGMMFNCYVIGQLSQLSFIFWAVWMSICIIIYLAYGLHHTQGEGSEDDPADLVAKAASVAGGSPEKDHGTASSFMMASMDTTKKRSSIAVNSFRNSSLLDPELFRKSDAPESN
jgi:hypothetical protein